MNKQQPSIFDGTVASPHPYITHSIEEKYWFHRSDWMENMLKDIRATFSDIVGPKYKTQLVTASRIGAQEMCLVNTVTPHSIVFTETKDGWERVAKGVGVTVNPALPTQFLEVPILCSTLQEEKVDTVYNNVASFKKRFPAGKVYIDASEMFGIAHIDFERLQADAVIISPEKGLGSIPGCTVFVHNANLLTYAQDIRPHVLTTPYTLDLLKYEAANDKNTTPYSPDISATVGLHASLQLLKKNGGLSGLTKRHASYRQKVIAACASLNIKVARSTATYSDLEIPSVTKVIHALSKKGIYVSYGDTSSTARVWHFGWLEEELFNRLFCELAKILETPTPTQMACDFLLPVITPPSWEFEGKSMFEINPAEFISQAINAAQQEYKHSHHQRFIETSARRLFQTHEDYRIQRCFEDRVVGFIGAGKTVREAVERLHKVGVKNIMVYSPSLSTKKRKGELGSKHTHKDVAYWESRKVQVADSTDAIFLQAHTVVLLPTLYDKTALRVFGKSKVYRNDGLINDTLLRRVKQKGRMDLLINASAREELIVRKHLAKHVSKGWLTFISDELPPENDPLFKVSHSYMTGHIGGSSSLTKKRVAQNTRVLLCELLKANPVFENFSFVNQHLTPRKSWRPGLAEEKEVRILLTDVFDKEALGLEELGRSKGATVRVVDMSHKTPTHQNIAAACKALQPHIIMIRTRTVIDAKMARILTRTPSLRALIRPGVGLDNVHRGIEALSTEGVRIFNEPTGNSFSVGEMTTHFILNGTPKIILAPGPTNIKKEVFAIFDTYTSPHSSQFKTRYTKTLHMLSEWIGRKGEVVMHATPSTGLMEAAITNLTRPGDTGAIIAHGKFGLRFAQIAKASSRESVSLSVGEDSWGQAFSPREISNLFQKASRKGLLIKFLCLQQLETSTGVSYNTQRLRSIIKQARLHNKDMIIIVDGVSATAADPIPYGSLDIDAIVVGSQKAFGLSSGLSFISLSPRAVDRIKKYSTGVPSKHTLYYDMSELLKMQHDHLRLGTPSVFHILSAHTSLSLLMQEGGPRAVAHRHYTLAKMVRAFAKQNNLPLLTQKGYESNAVTAIRLPKPFFAPMIRKRLEQEYGIFLAGAQSEALKPSLIRIGHLGYVTKQDMARCLRSLSIVLREYREQP